MLGDRRGSNICHSAHTQQNRLLFLVLTIHVFNKRAYLTFTSLFHTALKDGMIAVYLFLRKRCLQLFTNGADLAINSLVWLFQKGRF